MKMILTAALLMLNIVIKADSLSLAPSVYYTNGSYSNNNSSHSAAVYNSLQLMNGMYLINSYDHLRINSMEWKYTQQFLTAGGYLNLFPWFLKFNYGHIRGQFEYKPFVYEYYDYTNLYNAGAVYYFNDYYAGLDYTFQNFTGYLSGTVNQITLRGERIISNDLFISIKPNVSIISDGRTLYSAGVNINYLLTDDLLIKAGGFGGERAYFFNPDLLTIFNQNEVQKFQLSVQLEYRLFNELRIAGAYQYTGFTGYQISYLTAGIKGYFIL